MTIWQYYSQTGPIYGESSAPVRWENTIAPWLVEQGFVRGENEPCVFYHPDRDLLVLLYVDDCMADGNESDINWFFTELDSRFKCKEADWLSVDTPLDYLGMEITMDAERIYLSMRQYIKTLLRALEFDTLKHSPTPICAPIDTDSPALSPGLRRKFMTAVGSVGWLVRGSV